MMNNSPYNMMGPPPQQQQMAHPALPQSVPQQMLQNPLQAQPAPPDFTRTAAGPAPGKVLAQKSDELKDKISRITFAQANLKYQKDMATSQKSAYEDILNRLKGSV